MQCRVGHDDIKASCGKGEGEHITVDPLDVMARPALLSSPQHARIGVDSHDLATTLSEPSTEEPVPAPNVKDPAFR